MWTSAWKRNRRGEREREKRRDDRRDVKILGSVCSRAAFLLVCFRVSFEKNNIQSDEREKIFHLNPSSTATFVCRRHSTEVAFALLTQLPWVWFLAIPKIYSRFCQDSLKIQFRDSAQRLNNGDGSGLVLQKNCKILLDNALQKHCQHCQHCKARVKSWIDSQLRPRLWSQLTAATRRQNLLNNSQYNKIFKILQPFHP